MSRASRGHTRLALLIAARTSLRSLGRSILIASMVAIPAAGLAAVAVVYDSSNATAEQRIETELGQNEARVQIGERGGEVEQSPVSTRYWNSIGISDGSPFDVRDALPAGTRMLKLITTTVTAATATGLGSFDAVEGPSWDESFAGMYSIAEGRAPRSADEVLVTAATLDRLGSAIGGTVTIGSSDESIVTIVGVMDAPILASSSERFFGMTGTFDELSESLRDWRTIYYLPDLALDWGEIKTLNKSGLVVLSATVLRDPPPIPPGLPAAPANSFELVVVAGVLAAFAAFEVALLAGAAFTVTARQQQRALATIASVGATQRVLRRILTFSGIVLGGAGGVAGVVLGTAAAAVFMAVTNDGSTTMYYGFSLPWLWLGGIIVFGMAIGWCAALLPARSASRFDVVGALRGSRRPPVSGKWRPAAGLGLLIVGIGVTGAGAALLAMLAERGRTSSDNFFVIIAVLAVIIGAVVAQWGVALCAPLILTWIARLFARANIGARLAGSDTARNPGRAVPAVVSIMTTVFVAVLAMSMMSSGQHNSINKYQFRTAVGQLAIPLTYYTGDNVEKVIYPHADAVVSAIRESFDVDELRILASVADPNYGPSGEDADGVEAPVAIAFVPDENLCPRLPASPDYTEAANIAGTDDFIAASHDWRCENSGFFTSGGGAGAHLLVGDASDLALLLDEQPSADALRMLETGGAVALYPQYVEHGKFTIAWYANAEQARGALPFRPSRTDPSDSTVLDAVVELPEHPIHYGVMISHATADAIGLDYDDTIVLARTATAPTTQQMDALRQAMNVLPDIPTGTLGTYLERGPQESAAPWIWGLLGLAGLITVASAAVAIGLARFDGRQDDATLASVGAKRGVRRSIAFWQAIVIVGCGTVLGAALGLVPALALSIMPNLPFAPPWLPIGLGVIALPLLIACGSWLFSSRNTVSARRLSIA